ncbi:hypothetical protein B1L88_06420 [Salmonella enterica subsp. enterica serovar Dublin]|nr:hypothetical protein B1L88_06420 [Salmonella enterica subsp. enterica serovar Dublin]
MQFYRRRSRFATVKAKLGGNLFFLPLPERKWQKRKESGNLPHHFIKRRFYLFKKESGLLPGKERGG